MQDAALLSLLQLASPALPIGAYSYSEGLETLVDQGIITNANQLNHWLTQELSYGAVRLEAAVMSRAYQATQHQNWTELNYWNSWLSATRESEELRRQSWQMGRSLLRLVQELSPNPIVPPFHQADECNSAIVMGMVAADWQINLPSAVLGFLHSWTSNLIGAGVKLIPLGQTVGQQILVRLSPTIQTTAHTVLNLTQDELASCGWGLALASMTHETQYSRLFRS
ncbi:urease accessory protein UreF [Pantanalinema sp. GBBB05]|uniref:urease accessory protein UreF n=1 Tax=Pantanalinema sp. GBBB05 TaxID=2604139 RepID=UPI001DFE87FF|nr:urease accessory protein UreF [Pantanalinema sp. GBBB05]